MMTNMKNGYQLRIEKVFSHKLRRNSQKKENE